MDHTVVQELHEEVTRIMRGLADRTLEEAERIRFVFVTNLQTGELIDIGPNGITNEAQYYSRRQADEIIRSLQQLGLNVESFFSEVAFFEAAPSLAAAGSPVVVFTTAEGGTGSGRRALIPALCSLLGLPHMNSGPHSCSLARHKYHANAVLRQAGIRVPQTWQYHGKWSQGRRPETGTRVICKPAYESMSIGVDATSVGFVGDKFDAVIDTRYQSFGQPVVVQEFITGIEVGVPVLRRDRTYALPPIEFTRGDGTPFLNLPKTFHNENLARDISHRVWLGATQSAYEMVQAAAVGAFDALEMSGVGRIDFRVDADGRPWAFDTNESPPPLGGTSFARSVGELGFSVSEMLAVWVGACLADYGLGGGYESDQNDNSQAGISRP